MILIFSYGKGRSHYTVHTARKRKSVWHARLSVGHRSQKFCKCKWGPYKRLELRVSEWIQKNIYNRKSLATNHSLTPNSPKNLRRRSSSSSPRPQRLTSRIAQLLLRLLSVRHFRRMVQNPYCRYKTILRGARQTLWFISWWNLRILFFWARHISFTFLWQKVQEDSRVESLAQYHSLFGNLLLLLKTGFEVFSFAL